MEPFFTALEKRVNEVDSLLCVGLDPHGKDLIDNTPGAVRAFCLRIIKKTYPSAAAYKPNTAFFEALGPEGVEVLGDVIRQIPDDIPVILDVKRGDIFSTAEAYAKAAFDVLGADAVTINPYLGQDAVQPFIKDPAKGAFVLCKTSNPGASDIQDLQVSSGRTVYEEIAVLVQGWNKAGNLGLVVGATQVKSLASVRDIDPLIWILAPGVGAQGGDLREALAAGLREDGSGILIPVSRSIARADDPGQEAEKIRSEINEVRSILKKRKHSVGRDPITRLKHKIAARLFEIGSVKFGEFTLKSGNKSPIYIDLRRLSSHPDVTSLAAEAYKLILDGLVFDHLAPLPYAALPLGTAASLRGNWSMVYPRKEAKDYGTKSQVEGIFSAGEKAVVIDDLITTGGSKLEGIKKLTENGLIVEDIVVLIDRSKNAGEILSRSGYRLHSFLKISELLDYYLEQSLITEAVVKEVRRIIDHVD